MSEQPPRWSLLDLKYEYLDDGFKIVAYTDVPCHLFCRMTKTEPLTHPIPVMRRGTLWRTDVRFCFVVYEDNEQEEAGDTLEHTFLKGSWPICEYRWFYFLGTITGQASPSETAIFKFRFPPPPPAPPAPLVRTFYAEDDNRSIEASALDWDSAHDAAAGSVMGNYPAPNFTLMAGSYMAGGWHYIWRSFLRFNTSPLPDFAVPSAATLSLWVWYASGTIIKKIYVTKGYQHSPVIPSDYGAQLGITDPAASLFPVYAGSYQDFPLTPAGIKLINPEGDTKLCVRGQVDLLNEHPVSVYNQYAWYYSAQKGNGFKPKLTITYIPASPLICH